MRVEVLVYDHAALRDEAWHRLRDGYSVVLDRAGGEDDHAREEVDPGVLVNGGSTALAMVTTL